MGMSKAQEEVPDNIVELDLSQFSKEDVEKIKALEAAGVTQFTIYLTNGSEEKIVAEYGEHVIPHFK